MFQFVKNAVEAYLLNNKQALEEKSIFPVSSFNELIAYRNNICTGLLYQ